MALIDITPVMASNTTPTPYVAGASSIYNSTFQAYKAFNGTVTDSNDCWLANGTTGAIVLDFGAIVSIKAFEIVGRYETSGYSTTAPKTFSLYGSNISTSTGFEEIYNGNNQILWNSTESRLFQLENSYSFRYFKLVIAENNGHVQASGVGLLKFYKDDGTTPVIENRNNSLIYTLPFGSKLRLDNLASDLTYMLATENDSNNFGTLRIVGEDGKFDLAKAGIKTELLWTGKAITPKTTYTLGDTLTKYKAIIIVASMYSVTANRNSISQMRTVPEILGGTLNDILIQIDSTKYIGINFTRDGSSFTIFDSTLSTGYTGGITSIYGIH